MHKFAKQIMDCVFQSTLPRRERRNCRFVTNAEQAKFQSTLPRRERLDRVTVLCCFPCISIHAPAKGATILFLQYFLDCVFQSTLPRRERLYIGQSVDCLENFNPRSREGSDPMGLSVVLPNRHFNPRSREGSDVVIWLFTTFAAGFQSTLPRRERRQMPS